MQTTYEQLEPRIREVEHEVASAKGGIGVLVWFLMLTVGSFVACTGYLIKTTIQIEERTERIERAQLEALRQIEQRLALINARLDNR